jgi:CubicO group peptidase (beta-lactamase class C family)
MKNQINIYIEEVSKQALNEGVFCGFSAVVSMFKNKKYNRFFSSGGSTRYDSAKEDITNTTLFDLASLTKPLCTTLCVLYLVAAGKLNLDESYNSLMNFKITPEKERIKIKNLLNHSSGFPSYKPYFKNFTPDSSLENSSHLICNILKEPLDFPPGSNCQYSDLDFILLGALIERMTGITLDALYQKIITDPLNLSRDICFLPVNKPLFENNKIVAATERCGWRNKLLQGEVHDEHCWLMGGVAGHAGLFGNVKGVVGLCEKILDLWKDRGVLDAFPRTLLQSAVTQKHPVGNWCLGFDTPSPGRSSSGRCFSQRSVGHLGFSGTSFWIDPDREIIIVLLTNRIHPSRENIKIRQFRPLFHDYLMEKIFSDL